MKATNKANLEAWLDAIAERYTVIAPRLVQQVLLYQPVASNAEVVFDFERTVLSPKAFFLPNTHVILEIEKQGREVKLSEPALKQEQVIFGVRPCDAQGLRALDALLLDCPPPDAYYAERREKTTLIGLACPQLWADCFCTSLGGAPDDASNLDVMLYKGDAGYLVLANTEKGAAIVEELETEETSQVPSGFESSDRQVPLLSPENWEVLFDHVYWQRLAERCLSCHACTYVCPTCRCFDVRDDTLAADAGYAYVQRLRAWDSCMASTYRRIAGGHNPRPEKAQRLLLPHTRYFGEGPAHAGGSS